MKVCIIPRVLIPKYLGKLMFYSTPRWISVIFDKIIDCKILESCSPEIECSLYCAVIYQVLKSTVLILCIQGGQWWCTAVSERLCNADAECPTANKCNAASTPPTSKPVWRLHFIWHKDFLTDQIWHWRTHTRTRSQWGQVTCAKHCRRAFPSAEDL